MRVFRPSPRGISRLFSTDKNHKEQTKGAISKLLVDLKSSSSDEQLKKNITEFEENLVRLNKSEALKTLGEYVRKGSAGISSSKEEVSRIANKVGGALGTASKPIQHIAEKVRPHLPDIANSDAARKIGRSVDEFESTTAKSSDLYKYGGVSSKKSREYIETELLNKTRPKEHISNPNAGSSVVTSTNNSNSNILNRFRENNPASKLFSYIRRATNKSDNVLIHFGRELISSIADRVSSIFSESETAAVLKIIKSKDPEFSLESFLKILREYIVPEILEAFVTGNLSTLRKWCSEGAFKVLEATIEPSKNLGHKIEGKILDIRDLDLIAAKQIDDRPVLVISLQAQQLFYVQNAKGELIDGSSSRLENVQYIMAFAADDLSVNPSGWNLVEVAIRDRNSSW